MDNLDQLPLVEVLWRDAEEEGEVGWNSIEEIKKIAESPCPLVRSVGYVLHNSESHISLIRSFHSGGFSTVEKIPKGFIEAIRGLERL